MMSILALQRTPAPGRAHSVNIAGGPGPGPLSLVVRPTSGKADEVRRPSWRSITTTLEGRNMIERRVKVVLWESGAYAMSSFDDGSGVGALVEHDGRHALHIVSVGEHGWEETVVT